MSKDGRKESAVSLDVKSLKEDGTFEGYGSVFNVIDSYRDIVMPGAFAASLSKRKSSGIKLLWQHDSSQPIGIWEDLAEDQKGLWGRGRLLTDVSQQAREAHGLLKAGAINGLSIGYREIKSEPHADKPGVVKLTELDLREISIVTFPANDKSNVDHVKAILARGETPTVRQFEEFLRDAGGFSKSLAAAIASKATPHLRGDPDAKANDAVTLLQKLLQAG